MKALTKFTIADIRSWKPRYDPIRYLPEEWSGTAIDILSNESVPFLDAVWIVARDGIVDVGVLRRFAAWCAAQSLFITKQTDNRAWNAVELSIKFSIGLASDAELDMARAAAGGAAWAAAGPIVGSAAWIAALVSAAEMAEFVVREQKNGTFLGEVRNEGRESVSDAQRKKLLSMLREESDFTLSNLLNDCPTERT